jgi:hypothetical protein
VNLLELKKPFDPNDIEWRVQKSGQSNNKMWAMVLAYVTNRAIMDRLDEVCGQGRWENKFTVGPLGGMMCGISIKIDDEWVTKWDGAEETKVEKTKGAYSASMKRAAVQWGIGRYLYDLDATFVSDSGKKSAHKDAVKDKNKKHIGYINWDNPKLPSWALPVATKRPGSVPPNNNSGLIDEINKCTQIDGLEALRIKVSECQKGLKEEASKVFTVKMIELGARWDKDSACFVKKDRHWYTDQVDQADRAGAVEPWWEDNKDQAANDLSEDDFSVVESTVRQTIAINQSS